MHGWINSLTAGLVLVGRLLNFPSQLLSHSINSIAVTTTSTLMVHLYKWWCWRAPVSSWTPLNMCCSIPKLSTKVNEGFVFFFFEHHCLVVQARFFVSVVFGQIEGSRSGGMTASESCGWQRCCYNLKPKGSAGAVILQDLGDALWPDQAGGCQCGETRETESQNVWAFALKMGCLHSKPYLEHCCHENIPIKIHLFVAQKGFHAQCFR